MEGRKRGRKEDRKENRKERRKEKAGIIMYPQTPKTNTAK